MSLKFCHHIQVVGSEFIVNNPKARVHPAFYQGFKGVMVFGDIFLG